MPKFLKHIILFLLMPLLAVPSLPLSAKDNSDVTKERPSPTTQKKKKKKKKKEMEVETITVYEEADENSESADSLVTRPSLFGGKSTLRTSHFSWGADIGSSIDLTTHDMTFVDLNAYLGYKSNWIRFAGAGASISSMINNSSRCYQVYGLLRTSFSSRPRLCFMDLRAGATFNTFYDNIKQTKPFGSLGLGITLAAGRHFTSHLIIGYTFIPVTKFKNPDNTEVPDLHFASIRIGCAF